MNSSGDFSKKKSFKLREIDDPTEILSIFKGVLNQNSIVTIWYNDQSERRFVHKGLLVDLDSFNLVIFLTEAFHSTEMTSKNLPSMIYFHSEQHAILFKTRFEIVTNSTISIPTPPVIRVLDYRETERYYYLYKDRKEVFFEKCLKESREKINYHAVLMDISVKGLSFVIDEDKTIPFQKGDLITIKELSDQDIPRPITSKVIYSKVYKKGFIYRPDKLIVGVLFNHPIKEINHKDIKISLQGFETFIHCIDNTATKTFKANYTRFSIGLSEEYIKDIINLQSTKNSIMCSKLCKNINFLNDTLCKMNHAEKKFLLERFRTDYLARAIRLCYRPIIIHFLKDMPGNRIEEILNGLEVKVPISTIYQNQKKLIIDLSEINHSKDDFV